MTCRNCKNEISQSDIKSDWRVEESGQCIACLDAAADAGRQRQSAKRAAIAADIARRAQLPSPCVIDRWTPVRDRYGRVQFETIAESHCHDDVTVDGVRYTAVRRWGDGNWGYDWRQK